MIYIGFCIVSSTLIFVVFKLLGTFKIDSSKAIVINYISAFFIGIFTSSKPLDLPHIISQKWFYGAVVLGFMFIAIFNIMAITAQKNGLSVTSVATKMSVVIPVVFGIVFYKEVLNVALVIGIVLALVSVYLTSSKSNTVRNLQRNLKLPIILFIGSGVIDTSIKFFQTNYMGSDDVSIFSASIFCFAALIGIIQLIYKKNYKYDYKTIIGGLVLGLVNFGSLYFLIKALQLENWSSATVFTLINVGIVMSSSLIGKVLFREQLLLKNWMGIAIAMVSIILITFAV